MAEQHRVYRAAFLTLAIFASRAPAADDLTRLPERIVSTLGIEMVLIRGGAFEMGFARRSPDRFGPAHPASQGSNWTNKWHLTCFPSPSWRW